MDPFSIATGSAGLVSLGITICDGLLTYCRTYKSRENDLNALGDHTGRLKVVLRDIEKRLQNRPVADASFRTTVMECFSACEHCIQDAQALNGKYLQVSATPNLSMRNRGKAALRRLQYPFEAERFETLRKQLNDFHSALSGLFLVMSYDLTNEIRHKVDSHSEALTSAISSQGTEISLQLASVGPSITHKLDEGLAKMEKSMQQQIASLGKQWENSDKNEVSHQSALGKDVTEKKMTAILPQNESVAFFDSLCSCRTNRPQQHERECFRSFQHKKVHIIAGKFRIFNLLLHFRLKVQRAPFAFARDLKVYPNFSIRSTVNHVDHDSEAFDLVDETSFAMMGGLLTRELQNTLRDCLVGLRRLFEEGKAWPTDITTLGESLLHIACYGGCAEFADDTAVIYSQYLKELVNLGVPMNDVSVYGHPTPLAELMRRVNYSAMLESQRPATRHTMAPHSLNHIIDNIVSEFMECGAELPAVEECQVFDFGGPYILPMLHRGSITLEDELGYGPLSRALIQQSELGVLDILSRSHASLLEKTRNMESPLHVAVPWPRGIELLLQLGGESGESVLNSPNAFDESPLDYALQLGQLSSVELLVNANAEIDLESTLNIDITKNKGNSPQIDEIIDFLCQILADRRKRMLCYVREWLPKHEIARFSLEDQDMLQDTAFEVSEVCHQSHHLTSWFRKVRPGSIYHSTCLSMSLARSLLRVGFQIPNTTFHGFTPLMTVDLYYLTNRRRLEGTVDLVTWFIEQGENLHASIPLTAVRGIPNQPTTPCSDFKTIHRIADSYGDGWYHSHITAQDDLRISHMREVVSDSLPDPCRCYCSLKGCNPATLFIRSFFNRCLRDLKHYLEIMCKGIDMMFICLSKDRARDIAVDAIRVSTFEILGMQHTCCKYIWQNEDSFSEGVTHAILAEQYKMIDVMAPEEVAEIQEEDQHLALRLEALMAEFTAKYDEQGGSLRDFFSAYWWRRMDEVEEEEEDICADELEGIRDIGVVLDRKE